MSSTPSKAIILFSGGLDSTTTLAFIRKKYTHIIALTFSYNQTHSIEVKKSVEIAKTYNIEEHKIINIDTTTFQNSELTNTKNDVETIDDSSNKDIIPDTYVPARNILFLSYALAFADAYNISDIYIGANQVDYSNYPDCREEFIDSFTRMANIGTKFGVEKNNIKIQAPLLHLTKSEIIKLGLELGVDYAQTHSCYFPNEQGMACTKCDSCQFRIKGFESLGLIDPVLASRNNI